METKNKQYRITIKGIIIVLLLAGLISFGIGLGFSALFKDNISSIVNQLFGEEAQDGIPDIEDLQDPSGKEPNVEDTSQHASPVENVNGVLVLVNKQVHIDSAYVPEGLVQVVDYVPGKDQQYSYARPELAEAFAKMQVDAKAAGLKIIASNAYRSYAVQKSTFEANVKQKGSVEAANKTSAKPGESEHQTGLAMDLTTKTLNYAVATAFEDTAEGKWVAENCHKYGLIIRFPKGKEDITGYNYEPWHIRYVGLEAAKIIYENHLTLEEFLETQKQGI